MRSALAKARAHAPCKQSERLSRVVNVILGAAYFAIIVWTILPADTHYFYRFIGVVENAVTLGVIWTALSWRREAAT